MKIAKAIIMFACALPAAASAQDNPMQGAFGNTIVSVQPDGVTTRTYVDLDGTYRSVTDGAEVTGRWHVDKGMICYLAEQPAPAAELCALGPKKKVGSKWRIYLPDDTSVKVSIEEGRP